MVYEVTVDYVTTATVVVEAASPDEADEKVWNHIHTRRGFENYMSHSEKNVLFGCVGGPAWGIDGFDSPFDAREWDGRRDHAGFIDLREV